MISIEAHRAAIGRYYNRAYHASNKSDISDEENECYCNYLVEDCNIQVITVDDYTDFRYRFHKYLTRCFDQIILEIKSIDESEFEYGFYNHLFDCYGKILDVVDDPTYLKILKLLLDGDIESNPGPTFNDTPKKGRRKKIGFKGTPTKFGTPKKSDESGLKNVVTLDQIEQWSSACQSSLQSNTMSSRIYASNSAINAKVSLYRGDITKLEVDAIVNAAKEDLSGGLGIDEAIHNAAGEKDLHEYCKRLNGCDTGDCKITPGFNLPVKHILHTVGPRNKNAEMLKSCYESCFRHVLDQKNSIKSVAFCCIATGYFGFPNKMAAEIALSTTREWLEVNYEIVDRVIFCTYIQEDFDIYKS